MPKQRRIGLAQRPRVDYACTTHLAGAPSTTQGCVKTRRAPLLEPAATTGSAMARGSPTLHLQAWYRCDGGVCKGTTHKGGAQSHPVCRVSAQAPSPPPSLLQSHLSSTDGGVP